MLILKCAFIMVGARQSVNYVKVQWPELISAILTEAARAFCGNGSVLWRIAPWDCFEGQFLSPSPVQPCDSQ